MGCTKLVFTFLLTVFLSQQHSSAYSFEELKEKAKAESQELQIESAAKLIEQLKEKWEGRLNGTSTLQIIERLNQLNPLLKEVSHLREMAANRQAALTPSLQVPFKVEQLEKLRNRMSQMTKENQELFASIKSSILARERSPPADKEMTKLSFPENGTSDGKTIQDCLAVITDFINQNFSFATLWGQIAANTIANVTSLLQCFQNGSTASATCIQNVLSKIPKNVANLGNQTLTSLTHIEGDFAKLSTCLSSA